MPPDFDATWTVDHSTCFQPSLCRPCNIRYTGSRNSNPKHDSSDSGQDKQNQVIPSTARKLTPSNLFARSPKSLLLKRKETVLFLGVSSGGPHNSTFIIGTIIVSDPSDPPLRTIVDKVDKPETEGVWPDLCTVSSFSSSPFLCSQEGVKGHGAVGLSTMWGSRQAVILASLADGKVTRLSPVEDDGHLYSWTPLNADGKDRILVSRSSLTSPPEVLLGKVDLEKGTVLEWTEVSLAVPKNSISSLKASIVKFPGSEPLETFVLQPDTSKPVSNDGSNSTVAPLILNPHGGPHHAITTDWNVMAAAFPLAGFTVAAPNYSCSLGFGKSFVQALLTKPGMLDVEDNIATVQHLVELGVAKEGKGQLFVFGWSHGGFLAGHLIGQYPDMFTKAVLANPVIAPHDPGDTDIPDWYAKKFLPNQPYPVLASPPTTHTTPTTDFITKIPFHTAPSHFITFYTPP